jgi:hypothetical protein
MELDFLVSAAVTLFVVALILAGAATGVRTSGFQFTPRRVRATT